MKSGIVTIIGRPSAGKSTFLNAVCGEKVSIVSQVPQTTRNAIRGIVNTARGQIVFIDTPGYHISQKKLNVKLQDIAKTRLTEADAVLYLLDGARDFGEEEAHICGLLTDLQERLVIAVNKMDVSNHKTGSLKSSLLQALPSVPSARIFTVSALKKEGLDAVLEALFLLLPESEPLYPPEFYTDQDTSFRITEIIREQAILHTRDEIPHAVYAGIQDAEMRKNGKELWVRALLYVEKESQKAMVIGKGAAVIKSIRVKSMAEMRKIFPYKVQLDLQVRVHKNWRQKDTVIRSLTE